MNRQTTLTALPLLSLAACCNGSTEPCSKPNVVLIYADDLGKGMLSSYGQQQIKTPNIDRIVNQGMKFENAYSSAYSAPARFSLLTGHNDCRNDLYTITRGAPFCVTDTTLIRQREDSVYLLNPRTAKNDLHLAEVFRAGGYQTCAIGKLEWGFLSSRRQMRERGWDNYFGYLDHNRCHGHYPAFLFEDNQITMIDGNTHADAGWVPGGSDAENVAKRWDKAGRVQYAEDLFIDKALTYLRKDHKKPFFLYYSSLIPHGSISVPAIHPKVASNKNLTIYEKEYASMILMLDDNVGKILDELERQGIMENTMVIFSADNGHAISYAELGRTSNDKLPLLNGKKQDDYKVTYNSVDGGDRFNGNGSTTGLKRSSHDGGINVPLAIYWKGVTKPSVTGQFVANYDFLPTIADLVGVKLNCDKDGISLLKLITKGEALPADRTIVIDAQRTGPMILNNEGWKLRYIEPAKCFELFDTNSDPMEKTNVIADHPEIAAKLKAQLTKECKVGYDKSSFAKGKFVEK